MRSTVAGSDSSKTVRPNTILFGNGVQRKLLGGTSYDENGKFNQKSDQRRVCHGGAGLRKHAKQLAAAIGWASWCILTSTVVREYNLRHDQRGFDVFFLHLPETGLLWH